MILGYLHYMKEQPLKEKKKIRKKVSSSYYSTITLPVIQGWITQM